MPKRFVASELWDEDWFLEMPVDYKLFWYYMLANCDHAGIFKVNLRSFCSLNEVKINSKDALRFFNAGKQRIRAITDALWFIEDFFVFQYGQTFNVNNHVHQSIHGIYEKYKIDLTSLRGLKDLKGEVTDRVKDKDKDIKKGGAGENKNEPVVLNGREHKPEKIGGKIIFRTIKGFEFDNDKTKVHLIDDTWQELGMGQRYRLSLNDLKPTDCFKGYSE